MIPGSCRVSGETSVRGEMNGKGGEEEGEKEKLTKIRMSHKVLRVPRANRLPQHCKEARARANPPNW